MKSGILKLGSSSIWITLITGRSGLIYGSCSGPYRLFCWGTGLNNLSFRNLCLHQIRVCLREFHRVFSRGKRPRKRSSEPRPVLQAAQNGARFFRKAIEWTPTHPCAYAETQSSHSGQQRRNNHGAFGDLDCAVQTLLVRLGTLTHVDNADSRRRRALRHVEQEEDTGRG